MITHEKRWIAREQKWVAAREVFDRRRFAVDVLQDLDTTPKRYVVEHHYAGTYPAARFAVGIFGPYARLMGVALFSQPMTNAVLTKYAGDLPAIELGRFVLSPEVGFNGETWLLARAFRLLLAEKSIAAVVSFADPTEWSVGGEVVKPEHWGTIYQASNALFVGRTCARSHIVLPDGRHFSPRALSKIRNGEQGRDYAERQLVNAGLPERRFAEDPRDWLARLRLSGALRSERHPGNLAYVFGLTPSARTRLRALHDARLKETGHTVEQVRGGLPYLKRKAA